MRVLLTGSSGLVGSALRERLAAGGHDIVRLVRSPDQAGEDAFLWDPPAGTLDEAALEGVDAVVHLAGETVAARWTADRKKRILASRVSGTRLLSEALARHEPRPRSLVSASGVNYYGNRGDQELTEDSRSGEGFLAEVVRQWEAATEPAARGGVRVVNLRTGIVLSAEGGALARMLPPFRLGLGGPIGDGRQYMSWISIHDHVRAIEHAIASEGLSGPANAVAPNPVTNREFAKTLGRVLHRPALLRAPLFPLKAAFGSEFVEETLLASLRVLPSRLLASGYRFEHDELEAALGGLLSR